MHKDRRAALTYDNAQFSEMERGTGFHQCHEWDGLVVGPVHDEWDSCRCFSPELKVRLQMVYRMTRVANLFKWIAIACASAAVVQLTALIVRLAA